MLITPDDERLTPYIRERIQVSSSGCWLWLGNLTQTGYPLMKRYRGMARQAVWRLIHGPLPARAVMKADCDLGCVNPNPGHMRPVLLGGRHGPQRARQSIIVTLDYFDHKDADARDLARRRELVEQWGGDPSMVV